MIVKWCALTFLTISISANAITGFWKAVDEHTGVARCIIAVYEYKGLYYGRMIGTCDKEGKLDETMYKPHSRAEGLEGEPFFCGLDLIWDLEEDGDRYKGKIVDPQKGNIYKSELWIEDENLIVRGKWWVFGRSQVWPPVETSDFPKDFKVPDPKTFVPAAPQPKSE